MELPTAFVIIFGSGPFSNRIFECNNVPWTDSFLSTEQSDL